jgi:hypothetical protein
MVSLSNHQDDIIETASSLTRGPAYVRDFGEAKQLYMSLLNTNTIHTPLPLLPRRLPVGRDRLSRGEFICRG